MSRSKNKKNKITLTENKISLTDYGKRNRRRS